VQPVACHAAVGAQPVGARADAVPGAPRVVRLQQRNGELFADELGQVQVRRGAQCVDVEGIQLVDRLAAGETLGHQGFGQTAVLRAGERDQPGMLRQAGTEASKRRNDRLQVHQGRVMVRLAARGAILTTS
jgi:hypothetical protein